MKQRFDKQSIRRLRENEKLTCTQFGRKIGVKRQQAARLENEPGYPSIKTLEKIMDVFELDVSYFFIEKRNRNFEFEKGLK